MGFVNSKRYDGVQLYHKANKDISYYIRYKDEDDKLKRVKIIMSLRKNTNKNIF